MSIILEMFIFLILVLINDVKLVDALVSLSSFDQIVGPRCLMECFFNIFGYLKARGPFICHTFLFFHVDRLRSLLLPTRMKF